MTLASGVIAGARLPESAPYAATYRATIYPKVKLGKHWFGFAAVQFEGGPYSIERANSNLRGHRVDVLQSYVGYRVEQEDRTIAFKAGHLASAFGSFPLRYDEMTNPLIDAPAGYGYYYAPVTLYGLPGAQVDFNLGRFDMRWQVTNSAPVNPQPFLAKEQYWQWAGGAGLTIRQGFRAGVSAHRGAYVTQNSFLAQLLSPGEKSTDIPATGIGVDLQWASGRWAVNSEFQRFQYNYTLVPTLIGHFGYVEARTTLNPRLFVAWRVGGRDYSGSAIPDRFLLEGAVGVRLNRHVLLKAGYQHVRGPDLKGFQDDVLAVRLVTVVDRISAGIY